MREVLVMKKHIKMDELKHILDTTHGTTKMVIDGKESEEGYTLNDDFAIYVDTDWIDKTVNAKEVVKTFKKRLEDLSGCSVNVFHINKRLN